MKLTRRLAALALITLLGGSLAGCVVIPPRAHGYYHHHDRDGRYEHDGDHYRHGR